MTDNPTAFDAQADDQPAIPALCPACAAVYGQQPLDQKTGRHEFSAHYSSDPIGCAFKTGVFSSKNWNCQTMAALREMARDEDGAVAWREDQACARLWSEGDPADEVRGDGCDGWVILGWYKNRGQTESAQVMCDDHWEPLTLSRAVAMLEGFAPAMVLSPQVQELADALAAAPLTGHALDPTGWICPKEPE